MSRSIINSLTAICSLAAILMVSQSSLSPAGVRTAFELLGAKQLRIQAHEQAATA